MHHTKKLVHIGMWHLVCRPPLALHDKALTVSIQLQINAPVETRCRTARARVLNAKALLAEVLGHDPLELEWIHPGKQVVPAAPDAF